MTNMNKELIEMIAEQIHIIWMEERINDGWTYGPNRDDVLRTTPCIVPYSQLPEEEKKYDRKTAETVIYALLGCGYRIIPPGKNHS